MAAFAYSLFFFLAICFCLSPCTAVLHAYIPVDQQNVGQRDELIATYFHLGFNYVEILSFLTLSHGIRLSLRQLKRILRNKVYFDEEITAIHRRS